MFAFIGFVVVVVAGVIVYYYKRNAKVKAAVDQVVADVKADVKK